MFHLEHCTLVMAPVLTNIHQQSIENPWSEHAFRQCLQLPTVSGCLAVANQKSEPRPLGFILWQRNTEECEILTICVLPNERHMGVGGHLVGTCIQANKNVDIVLEVAKDNMAAISLYQNSDFQSVGTRPNYYKRANGKKMDAMILRRPAVSKAMC